MSSKVKSCLLKRVKPLFESWCDLLLPVSALNEKESSTQSLNESSNNDFQVDLVFVCEDQHVWAHKSVFIAASKLVRDLAKMNQCCHCQGKQCFTNRQEMHISLDGVKSEHFFMVLELLYSGLTSSSTAKEQDLKEVEKVLKMLQVDMNLTKEGEIKNEDSRPVKIPRILGNKNLKARLAAKEKEMDQSEESAPKRIRLSNEMPKALDTELDSEDGEEEEEDEDDYDSPDSPELSFQERNFCSQCQFDMMDKTSIEKLFHVATHYKDIIETKLCKGMKNNKCRVCGEKSQNLYKHVGVIHEMMDQFLSEQDLRCVQYWRKEM